MKPLLLIVILVIASEFAVAQQQMKLTITAGGVPVSDNRLAVRKYVAGSLAQFLIGIANRDLVLDTAEYTGRSSEWPRGLQIHVASSDGIGHDEWLSEMDIHRFVPWDEAYADSLWRVTRHEIPAYCRSDHYDFIFTIPVEAAGGSLEISATFEHPRYGRLATQSPAVLEVVPCLASDDVATLRSSHVYYTYESGDYARTLVLADSFVALGYTGLRGLDFAQRAGIRLQQYDAVLRYMDLSMAANGSITTGRSAELPDWVSPEEGWRILRTRNEAEYERLRKEYLQKLQEQRIQ